MPLARADLESLLRVRQLDKTLTSALPSLEVQDDYASGSTGVAALDARLGGGLPRGEISEIVGPRSSGRTSLLVAMLAAATARGERAALIDALDMFDVASAAAAGVALDQLLWVRGRVAPRSGPCRDANARALTQAIRACTLALASGVFGLVVCDVAEAPRPLVAQLPFTTWLRLHRVMEGGQTMGVLVGSQPLARSAGGVSIRLEAQGQGQPEAESLRSRPRDAIAAWGASGDGAPRAVNKAGSASTHSPSIALRVIRARARALEETTLTLTPTVSPHV
jgi:hypothetical protein